jgi:hypothetical protein
MNDDFLHQYRKPPRREFADRLFRQISAANRRHEMLTQIKPLSRRLALSFAALCLVFTLALAVSPAARAKFLDVVRPVGGLTFIETLDYPGSKGPEKLFPEQKVTLAQAQESFPASFSLPAYVPQGMVFNPEDVTLMNSPKYDVAYVYMYWEIQREDRSMGRIGLRVFHRLEQAQPGQGDWIVGPGSVEEVQINGQPAGLVRGAWDYNSQQWGAEDLLQLTWEKDGIQYYLSSTESTASVEELVKMAESMP